MPLDDWIAYAQRHHGAFNPPWANTRPAGRLEINRRIRAGLPSWMR